MAYGDASSTGFLQYFNHAEGLNKKVVTRRETPISPYSWDYTTHGGLSHTAPLRVASSSATSRTDITTGFEIEYTK